MGQQDSQAVPPVPAHALIRRASGPIGLFEDLRRDLLVRVVPREEAGALPGEGGVVRGALKLLCRWRWEAGARVEGAVVGGAGARAIAEVVQLDPAPRPPLGRVAVDIAISMITTIRTIGVAAP